MEENRCSVCGSVLNAGDAFCPNCGSPVEQAQPTEEQTAQPVEQPVEQQTTQPVEEKMAQPVGEPVEQPAETQQSAMKLESDAVTEETTVLSGNPNQQMSGVYNSTASTYNATYQDIPMDSTNYQNGYPQNTGVYTQTYEEPKKKAGKGLGIAAMIIGIISILCCPAGALFGLIAIILSIVCMAQKKAKPFSIIGLITGILGFILGIIVVCSLLSGAGFAAEMMNEFSDEYSAYSDTDSYSDYDTDYSYTFDLTVGSMNQMVIDNDTYTIPDSLSGMGLSLSSSDADVAESIATDGMEAGDYEFVLLDSADGTYSVWGYIENTGSDTVYSVEELQVTGLNVDNYSGQCDNCAITVYGGVSLNMSRTEVESLIGSPDYEDEDDIAIYENSSGDTYLRIGYDSLDYVEELDITYYTY